jgi:tetratricopeptide (TPR) repeat protein
MIERTLVVSIFAIVFALASLVSAQGSELPSQVLSPVDGPLEVVSTLEDCSNTQWCFNQHQTGGHVAGGGICGADDTYAWDANLNTPSHDSDYNQPVYAVAPGIVTQTFGGCLNANDPGSYGQVLIEHDYQGTKWWSGYLHLANIQVSKGQNVTEDTIIGYVSHIGVPGSVNHLHFAVYTGDNSRGKLKSFSAQILPRSYSSNQETSTETTQDESFEQEGESGTGPDDATYWAESAYELMNQDRWEEALQALDKSIEQDPDNSEVWRNRGVALHFLGRYEEAIQSTERAIEIDPGNANAVNQRNQFTQEQGMYSDIQDTQEQDSYQQSDEEVSTYQSADTAEQEQVVQDETESFGPDQQYEEEQNDAAYWAQTADDLMYQDRYEEALEALDKSIELNPNNSEVWRNKGVALYFLGRCDEAIWATEKAIEVDPGNINAVNQRDQFIQEQGN